MTDTHENREGAELKEGNFGSLAEVQKETTRNTFQCNWLKNLLQCYLNTISSYVEAREKGPDRRRALETGVINRLGLSPSGSPTLAKEGTHNHHH